MMSQFSLNLSVILLPVPGGDVRRALNAVLGSQYRDLEVLVPAGTAPPAAEQRVRVMESDDALTMGNAALAAARGRYIHICQSDGFPGTDFYSRLLAQTELAPDIVRGEAHQWRAGVCIGESRLCALIDAMGPPAFNSCVWTALLRHDFLRECDLSFEDYGEHAALVLLTAAALRCRTIINVPGAFYEWHPRAERARLPEHEAQALRAALLRRASLLRAALPPLPQPLLLGQLEHLQRQLAGAAHRLPVSNPLHAALLQDAKTLANPAAVEHDAPADVRGELAALRHEVAELRTLLNARFSGYIAAFHRSSALCYEDADVRLMQQARLVSLRAFDELCQAEGLRYFLYGGTLLGALRHQGCIPWHETLEVGMTREDYELLQASLVRRGSGGGQLHEIFWRNGTFAAAFSAADAQEFVDLNIYVHDDCVAAPRAQCLILERRRELLQRSTSAVFEFHGLQRDTVRVPLGQNRNPCWLQLREVLAAHARACGALRGATGSCANLTLLRPDRHIALVREALFPLDRASFEGLTLPVPHDPDALLRAHFGNYHVLADDVGCPDPQLILDSALCERLRAFLARHPAE